MAERKRRKLLSADFKPTAKVNGTVASHSVDSSLNVLVEHVDQGACGHPEFAWRWPQEVLAKLCSHERGIDFSSRLARVCGQGFVMSTACSGLGCPELASAQLAELCRREGLLQRSVPWLHSRAGDIHATKVFRNACFQLRV